MNTSTPNDAEPQVLTQDGFSERLRGRRDMVSRGVTNQILVIFQQDAVPQMERQTSFRGLQDGVESDEGFTPSSARPVSPTANLLP
jgi:hypothetical protein